MSQFINGCRLAVILTSIAVALMPGLSQANPAASAKNSQQLVIDPAWYYMMQDEVRAGVATDQEGNLYFATDKVVMSLSADKQVNWQHTFEEGQTLSASSGLALTSAINPQVKFFVTQTEKDGNSSPASDLLVSMQPDGSFTSTTLTTKAKFSPAIGSNGQTCFADDQGFSCLYKDSFWHYKIEGQLMAGPILDAEGTLYGGSDNGNFYALKLVEGNTENSLELAWQYTTGQQQHSSAAIDDYGSLFFGTSGGYLYALSHTGKLLWRHQTEAPFLHSPVIGTDGTIYALGGDQKLYAVRANGERLWTHDIYGANETQLPAIQRTPLISKNGTIYIGSKWKDIIAINPNGSSRWKYYTWYPVTSSLTMTSNGTLNYYGGEFLVFAMETGDGGLADSPWPTFGGNNQRTGQGKPNTPAQDTDGDSIPDRYDNCPTIANEDQLNSDKDLNGGDACDPDDDNDKIPDDWELANGFDPLNPQDADLDNDGDGYTNWSEYNAGSDPEDSHSKPQPGKLKWQLEMLDRTSTIALNSVGNLFFTQSKSVRALNEKGEDVWRKKYVDYDSGYSGYFSFKPGGGLAITPDDMLHYYLEIWRSSGLGPSYGTYYLETFNSLTGEFAEDTKLYTPSNNPALGENNLACHTNSASFVCYPNGYSEDIGTDLVWYYTTEDYISDSPVIGQDGTIYGSSTDGHFYAVKPQSQGSRGEMKLQWRFHTGRADFGPAVISDDGTIYFSSSDQQTSELFALSPQGKEQWRFANGNTLYSPVIGYNDILYIPDSAQNLLAIDANGELLWSFNIGGDYNEATPLIAKDGSIYIGSSNGFLYALNPDGSQQWAFNAEAPITSALAIADDGTLVFATNQKVISIYTQSGGLADSPWPTWGRNNGRQNLAPAINEAKDLDKDGSADRYDNCPNIANPDQLNSDNAEDGGDACDDDDDNDLLPDAWELANGTNPQDPSDATQDNDGDGFTLIQEYLAGSDPKDPQSVPQAVATWQTQSAGLIGSSAALADDGTIYVGSMGYGIHAYNTDGSLQWQYAVDGGVWSTPAIDNEGNIYFGGQDGYLYALNKLGQLRWRMATDNTITASPAIDAAGNIYIGSHDHSVYAVNQYGSLQWQLVTEGPIFSSPAIGKDGTAYIGSLDGHLYAIGRNGKVNWRYATGGGIYSSPAIDSQGNLYFGSNDAHIYSLNSLGELNWRYLADAQIHASPVMASDGTVYIGSHDKHLYALDSEGNLKWRYQTGERILASPTINSNGNVLVTSVDGYLYNLAADGQLDWRYILAGRSFASPALTDDGTLYVGNNGHFYALKTAQGSLAQSIWPTFGGNNQRTRSLQTGNVALNAEAMSQLLLLLLNEDEQ